MGDFRPGASHAFEYGWYQKQPPLGVSGDGVAVNATENQASVGPVSLTLVCNGEVGTSVARNAMCWLRIALTGRRVGA